jgi:hypothetical protein
VKSSDFHTTIGTFIGGFISVWNVVPHPPSFSNRNHWICKHGKAKPITVAIDLLHGRGRHCVAKSTKLAHAHWWLVNENFENAEIKAAKTAPMLQKLNHMLLNGIICCKNGINAAKTASNAAKTASKLQKLHQRCKNCIKETY